MNKSALARKGYRFSRNEDHTMWKVSLQKRGDHIRPHIERYKVGFIISKQQAFNDMTDAACVHWIARRLKGETT